MPELISVDLNSWIIQDGNYPDLISGQTFACALEYFVQRPLVSLGQDVNIPCTHVRSEDIDYAVTGRTVFVGDDWHVIDIGLLVYAQMRTAPLPVKAGMFSGHIGLGIDPFPYFESLAKEKKAPALIYDWRVQKIEIQTAPWIEKDGLTMQDPQKLGWREVAQTQAWTDDKGLADYIITLENLGHPPRRAL